MNRHTDDDATDDIYQRYQDTDLYVSRNEFRGAVHGAVKVDLSLEVVLTFCRFLLRDGSRIVFRLYRHLLSGKSIQGESRRNFGNPGGAFCDYDELNGDNDDKDDESDHHPLESGGTDNKA